MTTASDAIARWKDADPGAAAMAATPAQTAPVHVIRTLDSIYEEIRSFTKMDFYADKPYILLVSESTHDKDPEKYQQVRDYLIGWAGTQRCKAQAEKSIARYEAKFRVPVAEAEAPATASGFPHIEDIMGSATVDYAGYSCTERGIAGVDATGRPFRVCSHPILITRRYENVTTRQETVDVSYYRDGRWHTLRQMPLSDIYSAAKIVGTLAPRGVSVTSETAKAMVEYLQTTYDANRAAIRMTQTTDTIGWQADGSFAPYTTPGVEIDAGGDTGELAAIAASLHTHGDPAVWIDAVKAIRSQATSLPIRIMMASAFASPLLEKLSCLPYWTHMVGNGSTGKTVTMRLCGTIWGDSPLTGGYMKTMKSTACAIEELAGFTRNLPLCLNELQTIQSERDFSQRVYGFCEGQGGNRGRRSGGLRATKRWYCGALSCGEQSIVTSEDRGGANSRVIEVPVTTKLYTDPQSFCSTVLDQSYGHAGAMYIKGVSGENWDALKAEIIATAHRLEALGKNSKQADAAAVILLADRLAEKYIFHDGILITEDDIAPYTKDATEIDDNRKALDWLRAYVTENASCFISAGNQDPLKKLGRIDVLRDTDGSAKALVICFLQTAFNREIKAAGYDARRFILWAIDQGICEDGRKYGTGRDLARLKKGVILPGKADRAYVFTLADADEDMTDAAKAEAVAEELRHAAPVQTEIPF